MSIVGKVHTRDIIVKTPQARDIGEVLYSLQRADTHVLAMDIGNRITLGIGQNSVVIRIIGRDGSSESRIREIGAVNCYPSIGINL